MNKIKKKALKIYSIASTAVMACALNILPAFADAGQAGAGQQPAGVDTTSMTQVMDVVFWLVRIILIGLALPQVVKIVQGQADEDTRARNNGIVTIVFVAAGMASTFAIRAIFNI